VDFGLTTLLGWGFVVILRLLIETSWGLALGVKGGLVVQAHPGQFATRQRQSSAPLFLELSGHQDEIGKSILLRRTPRKQ
jgi:hypothetical protein